MHWFPKPGVAGSNPAGRATSPVLARLAQIRLLMTAKRTIGGYEVRLSPDSSRRMKAVGTRGTKPELVVRKLVTALGHRYRLNCKGLPGRPDLANISHSWAILVHGCYWHRHPGCRRATTPKRNRPFWENKFQENVARDERVVRALQTLGLACLVVWECETHDTDELGKRLETWFASR